MTAQNASAPAPVNAPSGPQAGAATGSQTIADIIIGSASSTNPEFSTLVTAIQLADSSVLGTLGNPASDVTLFAPTDAAFELFKTLLGEDAFNDLLGYQPGLTGTLLYHVLPGRYSAADLLALDGQMVPTAFNGVPVAINVNQGDLYINNAKVIISDIPASNGVIHVIDLVLVPAEQPLQQVAPPELVCPPGYDLADEFANFPPPVTSSLIFNFNDSDEYTVSVPEARDAQLAVWSLVGHPEAGCPGGFSYLCQLPNQTNEHFNILLDGQQQAYVPDAGDHIWDFFGFVELGELAAGEHTLTFAHAGNENGNDTNPSVGYKVGLCLRNDEPMTGKVIVVKDAQPDSATDVPFTGDLGDFALDDATPDDGDGVGNQIVFDDLLPGDYTITELVPDGWTLAGAGCVTLDPMDTTSVSGNSVTVDVDEFETLICTFYNTATVDQPTGTVTIAKATDPAGGTGFSFSSSLGDFTLDDGDSTTFSDVPAGTVTVIENVPPGWALSNVECQSSDTSDTVTTVLTGLIIDLDAGEDITCTFFNVEEGEQPTGSITIAKTTDPAGGTGFNFSSSLGDFALDDGDSTTFSDIPAGVYTVIENVPSGWVLDDVTCTGGTVTDVPNGVVIELAPDEDITCTFDNSRPDVPTGSITIVKDATPADGTDVNFGGSLGTFTLDDAATDDGDAFGTSRTFSDIPAGTYFVVENVPAGWNLDNAVCTGGDAVTVLPGLVIDLDAGEDITCTFFNSKPTTDTGTIIIQKDAEPADGTPFNFGGSFGTFALADDGTGQTDTRTISDVTPGLYAVFETVPAGWSLDSIVCSTADPDDTSSTSARAAIIDLDAGETVTCVFTNVELTTQTGTIIIQKDADPGDGTDFAFTSSELGPFTLDDASDVGGDDGDAVTNSVTFSGQPVGVYTVTETVPPEWALGSITCSTADANDTSVKINQSIIIDLDADETITCTFSNTEDIGPPETGTVIVNKIANPADGTDFAFSSTELGLFTLDDASPDDGDAFSNSITFSDVPPGGIGIEEVVPPTWDLDSVVCQSDIDDTGTFYTSSGVLLTLDPGETVVCTFTNTEQISTETSVTIVKSASPQDGTNFQFTGDLGNFQLDDADPDDNDGIPNSITDTTLTPGLISVTEFEPDGWELGAIVCDSTDQTDTPVVDLDTNTVTIDLDAGEQITCIFVNALTTEGQGALTIVKIAEPEDGTDFNFTGDLGEFTLDLGDDAEFGGSKSFEDLAAGSYRVREVVPLGWSLDDITCDGLDPDDTTVINLGNNEVVIDLDDEEEIVCVFFNSQDQPEPGSITIIKDANPLDGALDGTDFDFTTNLGDFTLDDADPDDNDGITNTQVFDPVEPGTYFVTEADVEGWALDSIVCQTNDTNEQPEVNGSTVTINLDNNEDVTCTFTNTEQQPDQGTVTIVKTVVLPDGADPDGTDFDFTGDLGAFTLDDAEDGDAINSTTGPIGVEPGDYTVTELVPQGWQLDGVTCQTDDPDDTSSNTTNGKIIDVDAGEIITCTFVNSRLVQPETGTIVIVKSANPADGTDFTFGGDLDAFTLDDAAPDDGDSVGNSLTFPGIEAGTYTVTENLPGGWSVTSIVCQTNDADDTTTTDGATATIDLDADEIITCTFTNTQESAQTGTIAIAKSADPADGTDFAFSSNELGGFTLDDAATDDGDSFDSNITFSDQAPGTYSITEADVEGWALDDVVCTSSDTANTVTRDASTITFDLSAGETIACTFFNRVVETPAGQIVIVKEADPADGTDFAFSGDLGGFTLDDAATDDGDGVGNTRVFSDQTPGTYSITEADVEGWTLDNISCLTNDDADTTAINGATVAIDLDDGEVITCIFTNKEAVIDPQIGTIVIAKSADPADGTDFAFTGDLGGFTLDSATPDDGDGVGSTKIVTDLPAGTYAVSEADVEGWTLDNIVCQTNDAADTTATSGATATIDLDAGEVITCTFFNRKLEAQTGTIVIAKSANPADGTDFAFTGDLGGFTLDDAATDDGDGVGSTKIVTDLPPGTYAVSENVASGWSLDSIVCQTNDADDTTSTGGATATIDLDAGEVITCTFFNRKPQGPQTGTLTVTKEVDWSGSEPYTVDFEICAQGLLWQDCQPLADGASYTWSDLPPGQYMVTETYPGPEWNVDGVPVVVTVVAGQDAAVTVRNIYSSTPPGGDEPELFCPPNYILIAEWSGNLILDSSPVDNYSYNLAEPGNGILVVWSKTGHPELGCPEADHRWCRLPNQDNEQYYIYNDDVLQAFVPDHGDHQWGRAPNVDLGLLTAGEHSISFRHEGPAGAFPDSSVGYKVGLCVEPPVEEPPAPTVDDDVEGPPDLDDPEVELPPPTTPELDSVDREEIEVEAETQTSRPPKDGDEVPQDQPPTSEEEGAFD